MFTLRMALSLPMVVPFDVLSHLADGGVCWQKLINSFKLYFTVSGAHDAAQKRDLLQHLARAKVQDIFFMLDNT